MVAEYRIQERNGKFTIETKTEKVTYKGLIFREEIKTTEWRGVTYHGHPLFRISARGLPSLDNYALALGELNSLEEAVEKIKEFKTPPVYYNEKGMPEEVRIPKGNVPRMRNPPPPPPPRNAFGTEIHRPLKDD